LLSPLLQRWLFHGCDLRVSKLYSITQKLGQRLTAGYKTAMPLKKNLDSC